MGDLDWAKAPTVNKAEPDSETIQGSQSWKRWRSKGLGSSDAAVLLGWSPWRTLPELYAEKRGESQPEFGTHQIKAMERGKRLEPKIRSWYEDLHQAKFTECTAEHPDHPFMRVSYDGLNAELRRIIEIKAPNAADHLDAKNGWVPKKYQPQVQWQLMISGFSLCDYVSYGSDDTYAVVYVTADLVMQAELRERAISLWNGIQQGVCPEFEYWNHPSEVVRLALDAEIVIAEQEVEALVYTAIKIQNEIVDAEIRLETVKKALKERLGNHKRAICGEAVLEWQERRGSVDYSKIPELKGVELDPYRKPSVRAFIFKRIKQ